MYLQPILRWKLQGDTLALQFFSPLRKSFPQKLKHFVSCSATTIETTGDSEVIRVTSVLLILTANKHLETLSYTSLRILNSIVFKESSFVFITCLIYPAPSCWPTPALSPPCQPPTLPDFPLQQEATKQPWKTLKQGVSVTSKTGKCCLFKQINFSVLP